MHRGNDVFQSCTEEHWSVSSQKQPYWLYVHLNLAVPFAKNRLIIEHSYMASSKATGQAYSSPPITEAVIGITFETPSSDKDISAAAKKLSSHYGKSDDIKDINVTVNNQAGKNTKPKINYTENEIGKRLSSEDMTHIIVVRPSTLTVSRLAPYAGWDDFFAQFKRDWSIWRRIAGFKKITRIGLRYINRLDIPINGPKIEENEYLNFYPKVPDNFPLIQNYKVNSVAIYEDIGCLLQLNSAVVESPLLNHISFIVDIDLIRQHDLPTKDELIYKLLHTMRDRKNEIFESCITDKARVLFEK